MFLQKIQLLHFKNYEDLSLSFSPQMNALVGENGSGKTNLLDAIYYLSLTKSAFNSIDSQNIQYEQDLAMIQGFFEKENKAYQVSCSLRQGQKKTFLLDKKPYNKIAEHIGKFPLVLISPYDHALIEEGSENRRSFLDSIICQLDELYLSNLMQYNHLLKQRNALLKQLSEQTSIDKDLIEGFDYQLLPLNTKIWQTRINFMQEFQPIFQENYELISQQKEQVALKYQSQLNAPFFEQNYLKSLPKDILLQRTMMGVHKDDLDFLINQYPLKKHASQGQQKSYLIALKLAQFKIMWQKNKQKPILLLDDIFDKLDEHRMNKLLLLIAEQNFGQIFLTDARPERTTQLIQKIPVEKKVIQLKQGKIIDKSFDNQQLK